jgi:hypothetical protein
MSALQANPVDSGLNDPEIERIADRLVPLDLWLYENARKRSIWWFGSPRLTRPQDMGRWLRRHEAQLTRRGAVERKGNAWRLIEPIFTKVMFEVLLDERNRAHRN